MSEASSEEILKILQLKTRGEENAVAHHTDKFEQVDYGDLIVRRGQEFKINIGFNRPFNKDTDAVKFTFKVGKSR